MWRFVRPDAIAIWRSPTVRRKLVHYYSVLKGERPPKYRVVKRLAVDPPRRDASLKELLELHRSVSAEFVEVYAEIVGSAERFRKLRVPDYSFLDLKVEIVKRLVARCRLCEWRCGAKRLEGERGVCGLSGASRVASAFLHMGEEAPLVPSGTIFFTGCSFKCVFCQNWDISTRPENGVKVSPKELADIAVRLYVEGARNINYVGGNPDQNLHTVLESLKFMDADVPLLWNSNMYMSSEALELLLDVADIWLPDFKYGNNECALRLSRVPRYFDVVARNHKVICSSRFSSIIIRHLVLPSHVECCTKPVLKWIKDNCNRALVNIMDQYRPEHLVALKPEDYPDVARRPSREELREAYSYADSLGIDYREVS